MMPVGSQGIARALIPVLIDPWRVTLSTAGRCAHHNSKSIVSIIAKELHSRITTQQLQNNVPISWSYAVAASISLQRCSSSVLLSILKGGRPRDEALEDLQYLKANSNDSTKA
jgi:hypothetical protein